MRHHGASGFYVLTDQLLYRDPELAARKLTGFVQVGEGDNQVDRLAPTSESG